MMSIGTLASKIFGSSNDRKVKNLRPRVADINALEPELEALSDEELRERTVKFRQQLAEGADLDSLLVPAFATVREGAKRTLGQRHFDVQMMGGMVLHQGNISEMALAERAPRRLAHGREGGHEQVVQVGALAQLFAEHLRAGPQVGV